MSKTILNTDTELWREPQENGSTDYYSNSIHHTSDNKLGINVGGHVIVKSLEDWHKLAQTTKPTDTQELELGEILTKFGRTYWHQTSNRQANVISPGEAETHINIARETAAKLIEQNYILKSQVLAAIPEKDTHSHMTRNYCLDCQKRDGFNQAIDQIKSALGLEEEK